jgi:hypothetical protein
VRLSALQASVCGRCGEIISNRAAPSRSFKQSIPYSGWPSPKDDIKAPRQPIFPRLGPVPWIAYKEVVPPLDARLSRPEPAATALRAKSQSYPLWASRPALKPHPVGMPCLQLLAACIRAKTARATLQGVFLPRTTSRSQ